MIALIALCLAQGDSVTWTRDVAPIVYENCLSCHRDGEVAPFALETYADVKKRARQIELATRLRLMPVWKPEPGWGDFVGARRLTDAQIATIKRWVDGGCVEGDPAHLPRKSAFNDGWALGTPDLVVRMPEAFTVPAEGRDVYRNFVLPLGLKQDRHVRAAQYRPSNRRVVHHALLFLDATDGSRRRDEQDTGPGFSGFSPSAVSGGGLGGWAPGAEAQPLPDGVGKLVKAGSDLILQLHLHPSGKEEKEQSEVGLYFCRDAPSRQAAMLPLLERRIDIPPGEKEYTIERSFVAPVDFELIGVAPHAHYLARTMKVWMTDARGKETPLLWIKDWDFDWQGQYRYREPVRVPKGARVSMVFTYDNSADNPRNPARPPARVRWGEQTSDEMAITFLQIVPASQSDLLRLVAAALVRRR